MIRFKPRLTVYKLGIDDRERTDDFPASPELIARFKEEIEFRIGSTFILDYDDGEVYSVGVDNIEQID